MAKNIQLGEYGSDATERLRAVIEQQHKETAEQTTVMVRLTRMMLALTIVTGLLTIVQVVLAVLPLTR
jgi:hypothetical protein